MKCRKILKHYKISGALYLIRTDDPFITNASVYKDVAAYHLKYQWLIDVLVGASGGKKT